MVARFLPPLVIAIYVVNECNGFVRKMLPEYSGGESGWAALSRLAQLKPDWPVVGLTVAGTIVAFGVLALLVTTLIRTHPQNAKR